MNSSNKKFNNHKYNTNKKMTSFKKQFHSNYFFFNNHKYIKILKHNKN